MRNFDRRTLIKGSLAAVMMGAATTRAAFADSSEPIMLGVSGPLTGPNAQYGAQWKQGFDLALDEIHAAGGEPDRAHRLAHMVPMKRVGQAEEIANAIVWLMSDEASYVTSTTLDVSGGR